MFQLKTVEYQANLNISGQLSEIKQGIIPGLIISNTISKEDCYKITDNFKTIAPDHSDEEIGYSSIGYGLTEFRSKKEGKELYFECLTNSQKKRNELFEHCNDPIYTILSVLGSWKTATVPQDPEFNQLYSFGVIESQNLGRRIHVDQIIDNDNDPLELSIVLYLQTPDIGGELKLYQKLHENSDGYNNLGDGFISESDFIDSNLSHVSITQYNPVVGDLLIFANKWYHQVLPSYGTKKRIAHLTTAYERDKHIFVYV